MAVQALGRGLESDGQEGKANVNMVAHSIQKTAEGRELGCAWLHLGVTSSGHTCARAQPQGSSGQGGLSGSSSAMNSIDPKETDATQDPGHCHEQDGLFHMLHLLCLQGSHYSALASKFLSSKYFHLCTIFISERINTQRGEKQTNKKGALQQFFLFNCLNLFGSFN